MVQVSISCKCDMHAGTLTYYTADDVNVKQETVGQDTTTTTTSVARWTALDDETLHVTCDLRYDVQELQQAKASPQLRLRLHQRGLVTTRTLAFDTLDDRAAFVSVVMRYNDAGGTRSPAGRGAALKVDPASAAETKPSIALCSTDAAVERQWLKHDAELRQLYADLVSDGLMTEEEFIVIHAEERAHFFHSDAARQRLGMTSVADAMGALVDPVSGMLLPITEEVAANVFRQSPFLARVYQARVKTPEDEIVFWDAVVRRALFLSRTLLDGYGESAADDRLRGVDSMEALWNKRSRIAMDPHASLDAPEPTHPPARLHSWDTEVIVPEALSAVTEHSRLEDLEAPGRPPIARPPVGDQQQQQQPLPFELTSPKVRLGEGHHLPHEPLTGDDVRKAIDMASPVRRGGGPWGSLLCVLPLFVLGHDTRHHHHHSGRHEPPPAELRTFHSLLRLFYRHLTEAGLSSAAGQRAHYARCADAVVAMERALSKALASGDATDTAGSHWSAALREADALLARVRSIQSALPAAAATGASHPKRPR